MKWSLLLLLVVYAGGAAAAAAVCAHQYFRSLNVTADYGDGTGEICKGHCCGRRREEELKSQVRRRMLAKSVSSFHSVATLIDTTRNTLQEHLTGLSRKSQNSTSQFFSRVYQNHAYRTREAITVFYDDMRSLLRIEPDAIGSPAPRDLADSTHTFFRSIFPVAYHKVLNLDGKQLKPEYEACLKDVYYVVQPFGDIPKELGAALSKSFEAARVLLQALSFGSSVLTASAQVLGSAGNQQCSASLVRTAACARCHGLDARPCRNYCLNVVRGCLGSLISELDGPWNNYVDGVERLTKEKIDGSIPALDSRISDAVMHAFTNNATLEQKVRGECGLPTTLDTGSSPSYTLQPLRRDVSSVPPPDTELVQFLSVLTFNNRLFSSLSDRICEDHDIANANNVQCWTGDAVGEYTKPLVRSASAVDQLYNAEVLDSPAGVDTITSLANKLKHTRQLLVLHSASSELPAAEAFMQGDEGGSGSGVNYGVNYGDDDDDDKYDGSGEGSGHHGRIGGGIYSGEQFPEVVKSPTASAAPTTPGLGLALVCLFCLAARTLT